MRVRSSVWFDRAPGLAFRKYFFLKVCFVVLSICITICTVLIVAFTTVHLNFSGLRNSIHKWLIGMT